MPARLLPTLLAWAIVVPVGGCGEVTTDLLPPIARLDAATDATASAPITPRPPVLCGDRPCACDDGVDNDDDGLIDGFDSECTGPYDDDEASFATGQLSSDTAACQDCFWDGNNQSDDDGCQVHLDCLSGNNPAEGSVGDCGGCGVSQDCINLCLSRTPNGCDCFGCCAVTTGDGAQVQVRLTEQCSVKDLRNPELCPPCVQHPTCRNDCGTCELCPGRKRKDLPAICRGKPSDPEPQNRCDEGQPTCSESQPCGSEFYCQLGCCLFVPQ
ncbi:MAG: hypothetical protein OEZ06_20735 [Myxococcales bacterium]|nr:hypothetical protein [Myxococcales bacterium]